MQTPCFYGTAESRTFQWKLYGSGPYGDRWLFVLCGSLGLTREEEIGVKVRVVPPRSTLGPYSVLWCQFGVKSRRLCRLYRSYRLVSHLPSVTCEAASPWHGRGRRFDPDQVHQISSPPFSVNFEVDAHASVAFQGIGLPRLHYAASVVTTFDSRRALISRSGG
jgi:hypothetical protein